MMFLIMIMYCSLCLMMKSTTSLEEFWMMSLFLISSM
ncbi:hypothetical protein GLYMA_16G086733v4 [Glycine max]|nr:hypothetical protein GLYMA_16G086733v4 [Glycine max]KAH1150557.1 hypothetical protein GYH30_044529 [Glycine max]